MRQFIRVNNEIRGIYAKYAKYAHPDLLCLREAEYANYAKKDKSFKKKGPIVLPTGADEHTQLEIQAAQPQRRKYTPLLVFKFADECM